MNGTIAAMYLVATHVKMPMAMALPISNIGQKFDLNRISKYDTHGKPY